MNWKPNWNRCACVIAGILLAGCASAPKSSKPEAKWINNMHRLSAAHLRLMPLVADAKKFADPNRRQIRSEMKEMVATAGDILNDNKAPDADPIIKFTAARLANETRQAYAAFEMGDIQWSRFAASRTGSYCISCHTRADRGVKDFPAVWEEDLKPLNAVQRVEFLLANRRYKSALAEARELASDKSWPTRDPRAWILAIERALAMVVRVNDDPAQAEQLVSLVYANKSAPFYVRSDAGAWLRDIREWKKESRSPRTRDNFKAAVRLVDRAQAAGPRSSASLIQYLRASRLVHVLLEDTQSSKYGETLLYAGIVSDSLRELNMGFLDQYYYESCINFLPHSELAESCYARLEASVRASNPFMELDVDGSWELNMRLSDFRRLAEVKSVLDDPRWERRFWEDELEAEPSRRPRYKSRSDSN